MKIQKKKIEGYGVGTGVWLGGEGGCERKIEVFVKIQKNNRGGGVGSECRWGGGSGVGMGVSVDVNEELKFL